MEVSNLTNRDNFSVPNRVYTVPALVSYKF